METTYKAVAYADITQMVALMRDFYAIDGYPIDETRSKEMLHTFLADENLGRAWLIISDNKIVGYVILAFLFSFEFGGKIAFLDELYIVEEARGKRIGNKTVDFIKEEAKRLSVKMLYLEVEHHNAHAQKLYLAKGFETHNRKFMQYRLNTNN